MFMMLRIVGAAGGVVTALNVLLGFMTTPEFVVADILIGVFLVGAALVPERALARTGLIAANAYALGVFSVALAARMQPEGVFNPGLVAIMIVVAASLALLLAIGGEANGGK